MATVDDLKRARLEATDDLAWAHSAVADNRMQVHSATADTHVQVHSAAADNGCGLIRQLPIKPTCNYRQLPNSSAAADEYSSC
jgi:hypothetical protein